MPVRRIPLEYDPGFRRHRGHVVGLLRDPCARPAPNCRSRRSHHGAGGGRRTQTPLSCARVEAGFPPRRLDSATRLARPPSPLRFPSSLPLLSRRATLSSGRVSWLRVAAVLCLSQARPSSFRLRLAPVVPPSLLRYLCELAADGSVRKRRVVDIDVVLLGVS